MVWKPITKELIAGYCLAIGEDKGDNQTGFGMQYSLKYKGLNPQEIGEQAGKRAVRLLGSSTVILNKPLLFLSHILLRTF